MNALLPGRFGWLGSPLVFLPPSGPLYMTSLKAGADGGTRDATLAEEVNIPGKLAPPHGMEGLSPAHSRDLPEMTGQPQVFQIVRCLGTWSLDKVLDVLI